MSPKFCARFACGLLAVLLLVSAPVTAQTLEQKFDEYLTAAVNVQKFQGAALVAKNGQVIFAKGYGPADMVTGAPNTEETVFLIGSITKQFTSAAIMQLVEQGKINLGDPLTKYLPDYPAATGNQVTIHHLLNHTSGIPTYTSMAIMGTERFKPITHDSLIGLFKDLPLEFAPGSQWRYNNSGYVLLGRIIEKVSGETYADYLKKHIFQPLGMKHSGYFDPSQPPAQMAAAHTKDSASDKIVRGRYTDMSWPFSAGALYSTVGDLLLWNQALLSGKVVSQESLQKMLTPGLQNYGYGLVIDSAHGRSRVWHGGGIDGFVTTNEVYPEDSLTVIILADNDASSVNSSAMALAAIVFGKPYDLPVKREPIVLDSLTLQEYVGAYDLSEGQYRLVSRRGDSMFTQRTGSSEFPILPLARDTFFYAHDNAQILSFQRGANGEIVGHVMRTGGQEMSAPRVTGTLADSLLQLTQTIQVSQAVLDLYVGDYELGPGFIFTVTTKDGRIYGQATGQPQIELQARSEETFVVRQVGAEISFVKGPDGKAESLMLLQAGQKIPAKKIK